MDILTIQRSLTLLEDRYRELREMGEKHLHVLEADVAKEKAEREALIQEKEALAAAKDALAKEKDAAVQSAEDLKQQLAAQVAATQQAQQEHKDQAAQLTTLEAQLAQWQNLHAAAGQACQEAATKAVRLREQLHRLRHLACSADASHLSG